MKILEESRSAAWCISRTGRVIPVRVHPFGALDDDSTEDAAWLYVVDDGYNKDKLVGYIGNQMCYDYGIDTTWSDESISDIVAESLSDIECLKGMNNVTDLIDSVSSYVHKLKLEPSNQFCSDIAVASEIDVETLGDEIKSYLNENYIRVRLGSEYQNYTERKGAMYFRTSSTDGFNWYPVICKFLEDLSNTTRIGEVTIERDVSATGERKLYVDHMSFNEFLLQKPQVIESVVQCGTIGGCTYE